MSKAEQKKILSALGSFFVLLFLAWQVAHGDASLVFSDDTPSEVVDVPAGYVSVSRVVDGDTIEVSVSETEKYKVRLIGINTPESVDPRKPVECFGREATEHLKQLLAQSLLSLQADDSQESEDVYGRWLRYVYLEDGSDINLQMIKDGYAYEYTYRTPYEHQAIYQAAEAEAKNKKNGLWSSETCGGKL